MRARGCIPAFGLALFFGFAGAPPARAGALPKTHGAMLDSVARLVASDLLRGVSAPAGRTVRIATPLPGDTLGLLAQRVVEQLRAGGFEVRLVPSRPTPEVVAALDGPPSLQRGDSTDLQLNLNVGSAGVTYVRAMRRFPFGVRGYERLASMRVGATLVDLATRDVLWARTAEAQAGDQVLRRDLAYAQSGSGGLNPALPRGAGGVRLLEPLIVVGVVAGLVVLFYSNR